MSDEQKPDTGTDEANTGATTTETEVVNNGDVVDTTALAAASNEPAAEAPAPEAEAPKAPAPKVFETVTVSATDNASAHPHLAAIERALLSVGDTLVHEAHEGVAFLRRLLGHIKA